MAVAMAEIVEVSILQLDIRMQSTIEQESKSNTNEAYRYESIHVFRYQLCSSNENFSIHFQLPCVFYLLQETVIDIPCNLTLVFHSGTNRALFNGFEGFSLLSSQLSPTMQTIVIHYMHEIFM